MSLTLTANITAGKAGGSTPVYLLELESQSTIYRFSTLSQADISAWVPGEERSPFTSGRLKKDGLGKITSECDITFGGNVGSVGDFKFQLLNYDSYAQSLADAGEIFENGRVELRLIYADKTLPSWANALVRFFGYVDDWTWDESFITFACKGYRGRHKALPDKVLTAAEFTGLPESNENLAIPIIYGDFTNALGVNKSGIASNIAPGGSQIIHRDYYRGIFLKPIQSLGNLNTDNPRTVWANHAMHTSVIAYQDLKKFRWNDTRNCWERSTIQFDGTEAFGSFVAGLETQSTYTNDSVGYVYPELIPITDSVNTSGATNLAYAVDEDDSNYTTLDANGEIASYQIPAGFGKGDGGGLVYLYYRVDTVNRVDDTCQIEVTDESGSVVYAFTNVAAYGSMQYIDITALITNEGDPSGIRIRFKYVDVTGHDAGCEFRIRSAYLRLREKVEFAVDFVYTTGKGRKYGDWIDETDCLQPHSTTYNEDDLIENAAYCVESLLHDELGVSLDSCQIFESANVSHGFDRIGLQRDSWKLARQILEQENSKELIRQIAYEFGFAYFQRMDGTETLARIDPLGLPTVVTSADVLMNGKEPSIKVKKVKASEIKNEFVLKYKQNYATGDFDESLYVLQPNKSIYSATYTNLAQDGETYWDICHGSYNDYSVTQKWEYEAKWIRNAATAELFLKFMIRKLTRRPLIVEFESSQNLCDIELMDIRRINHRLLATSPNQAADGFVAGYRFSSDGVQKSGNTLWTDKSVHFRCIKQEIDPKTDTINHTFLDVGQHNVDATTFTFPRYAADGTISYISPTLFLDPDDLLTNYNDGDNITAWTDKSTSAWVFTEATKTPSLSLGEFHGHAGVLFAGNERLESASATLADLIDADEMTLFIVATVDSIDSNEATVSSNDAIICDKTNAKVGLFLKSAPTAHFVNNDGSEDSASMTVSVGKPTLLMGLHDSANAIAAKQNPGDPVDYFSGSGASGATAVLTNKILLGENSGATNYFTGKLGVTLIYNVALTTAEQQLIADALRTKYGLY